MPTSKILVNSSTWTPVAAGPVTISNTTKSTLLWAAVASGEDVPTAYHQLAQGDSMTIDPGAAGLVTAKLLFPVEGSSYVVCTPGGVADVKKVLTLAKLGCTTGDQVFTGLEDTSFSYQLDVSSASNLTGTLTVVYSVPGVDRLKVLKDTGGAPITINLADPRIVTVTGLHLSSLGVRPTVAVSGGTYDLALTVDSEGVSSRG